MDKKPYAGNPGNVAGKTMKASGAAASPRSAVALTHDQIAQRAKAIWQAKGCPAGRVVQNWNEAEAQLKAELSRR